MLWESKGRARGVGVLLLILAQIADHLPFLAPYKEILLWAGNLVGGAGVLNAVAKPKE